MSGCTGCLQGCGYCTMRVSSGWQTDMTKAYDAQRVAGATKPPSVTKPSSHEILTQAANTIREKLKVDRALYAHYLAHVDKMREQEDLHGGWDAFANASEVSNRIDVYLVCLQAMGCEP